MPRRFDADLCRANGFSAGDILLFIEGMKQDIARAYFLSAVGWRSILTRGIYQHYDGDKLTDFFKPASREMQHAGSLYKGVWSKVGRCEEWLCDSRLIHVKYLPTIFRDLMRATEFYEREEW